VHARAFAPAASQMHPLGVKAVVPRRTDFFADSYIVRLQTCDEDGDRRPFRMQMQCLLQATYFSLKSWLQHTTQHPLRRFPLSPGFG
jgi:hypothetical protein